MGVLQYIIGFLFCSSNVPAPYAFVPQLFCNHMPARESVSPRMGMVIAKHYQYLIAIDYH
jgi:hypothetical protein